MPLTKHLCVRIAEKLYQKSTHFVLELIQNADDNNFKTALPTLAFKYKDRFLQIDCNETGFTAENVSAICSAGDSSKVGKAQAGRYIGQKGIGFKSVFKAADLVWISSGAYSFKFDKNQPLGIITPVWDRFPGEPPIFNHVGGRPPSCTSFYLQLAKEYNEQELIKDLSSIDSRLLIFLRKLKRIDLKVVLKDGTTLDKKLEKLDNSAGVNEVCVLKENGQSIKYTVLKHVITQPKTVGHPLSEIVIAFPDSPDQTDTGMVPQQVYAFLPIQSYNFTVCLNVSNFYILRIFDLLFRLVLVASRFRTHSEPRRN